MIVVVPDYRHAYPPPVPDGQTVRQPDPAYQPPHRGGIVTTIAVCTVIVLALMVVGIVTR